MIILKCTVDVEWTTNSIYSVSEKVFDMPDIMSEAYRSSIGHCSLLSDIGSI